jgi:hypothetical protein
MNRQERAAIWRDELAHPCSPTTVAAMQASGADMSLVAEWQDLEGQNEPGSDWMVYEDFLKGAIGIAADHDPKNEFETPSARVDMLRHQLRLWEELGKVTDAPHNEVGENHEEKERYDRILADGNRRRIEEAIERSRGDSRTETIVEIPGTLFARWGDDGILGFGFSPPSVAAPEFAHLDGPERFPLNDRGSGFWPHLRQYLQTVLETSGENAIAVAWAEDGWRCRD